MNISQRLLALGSLLLIAHLATGQQHKWIATWAASPEAADADPHEPILNLNNQTVRERVRVSVGGAQIRILFSNECSSAPLLVGRASVAIAHNAASVVSASIHPITFGGRASITVPSGAPALSDPINLAVKDGTEISISLYFPRQVTATTWHALANKTAIISTSGDHTQDTSIQDGTESRSSVFLASVLIPANVRQHVIVAIGDSIVDGDGSTPEADHNWPADLARRIAKTPRGSQFAVVNQGIAGNRLVHDGPFASLGISTLARFNRDVLSVAGVTNIVLLEGINDISFPGAKLDGTLLANPSELPRPEDIITAYQQLISRAHARGIRIIGTTIMPCEGVEIPGYYSETKNAIRQAVNKWIRNSGQFDGIVDFDTLLRDPSHPTRLLPRYSSADHLHPNDAGYQAMADAINLSLFQ